MNTQPEAQHNDIAELLPDFAIGALDDGDLWRVETHLETCARCREELTWLVEFGSMAAPVEPPSLAVKRELFQRAGQPLPERLPDDAPRPLQVVPVGSSRRGAPIRRLPVRLAWIALPAAAVALLLLGGWNILLQRELDDRDGRVELFAESANAYPLTDSETPSDATATILVDRTNDEAILTARGLPTLEDGQNFQVWLFTQEGDVVNAGSLTADAQGAVVAAIDAPQRYASYWAVGVSIETNQSGAAPSSPLLLGGWIQ